MLRVGLAIGLVAASAQLTLPTPGAASRSRLPQNPANASCTANVTANTTLWASLLSLTARGCANKTLLLQAGRVYKGENNTINLTSGSVDIVGNRATIDANWLGRHFVVSGSAHLKLSNLKLRHGHAKSPIGEDREACGGSVVITDAASFSASRVAFEANLAGQTYNVGRALTNGGGAVCATHLITTALNFEDCNFTNNTATANRDGSHTGVGGAVYFNFVRGPIRMSGCRFVGNSAWPPTDGTDYPSYGGALWVVNATAMEFIACLWQRNVAYGNALSATVGSASQGGAISMLLGKIISPDQMFDATVRFKGCTFAENQVLGGTDGGSGPRGGAVKFEDYSPIFEDCVFERNEAPNSQLTTRSEPSAGGAVCFAISFNSSMTFVRCRFLGNTAGWGGAIIAELTLRAGPNTFAALEISTSSFEQNTASVGGALYLQDIPTQLSDCTLTGNSARSDDSSLFPVGGAIAYTAGVLDAGGPLGSLPFLGVNRSRFVANRAVALLEHDYFYASGGAMHMSAHMDLPVVIIDSSFEGNAVQGGQGCLSLQGGGGGALAFVTSADGNVDMRLEGTKLLNNNVDRSDLGGALMVLANSSSVRMMDSVSLPCAVIDNSVVNGTFCDAESNGYSGDGSLGGQLFASSPRTTIDVTCTVSVACEHALDCSECLTNETCAWAADDNMCTTDLNVGSQRCPVPPTPWWRVLWVRGMLGVGGALLLCTVVGVATVGLRWRQKLAWQAARLAWRRQPKEFSNPEVLITPVSKSPSEQIFSEAEAIRRTFGAMRAGGEVFTNDMTAQRVRSELKGRRFWFFVGHGKRQLHEHVPSFEKGSPSKTSIVKMIRTEVVYGRLELVVLNACHTCELGQELLTDALVPCVVCWENEVDDEAAEVFGQAFAQSLAKHSTSAQEAFEDAKNAVRSETKDGVQKFHFDDEDKYGSSIAAGTPRLFSAKLDDHLLVGVDAPTSEYKESEVEQTALQALLDGRQTTPLIVRGPAGVGKSQLAWWLALNPRVQTAFPQGIFALRFEKLRSELPLVSRCRVQHSISSMWERLANLLVDVEDLREKPDQVKGRRILLILDGVWDEEQVRSFSALGSETFAVLVTTRLPRSKAFGEWLEIDSPCNVGKREYTPLLEEETELAPAAAPTEATYVPPEVSNRPTRALHDGESSDDSSDGVQYYVTGPKLVHESAEVFTLQVWAMIKEHLQTFTDALDRQQDNAQLAYDLYGRISNETRHLQVRVDVRGCDVKPRTSEMPWSRKKSRKSTSSTHTVHIPAHFDSSSFLCTVEISQPSADRPLFERTFEITRRALGQLIPTKPRSSDRDSERSESEPVRSSSTPSGTSRPTLAVGALRASGGPVMRGSAIFWEASTGLCTTAAHVVLDCAHVDGALDPKTWGVAIGVGSADSPVRWLYKARVVGISFPPRLKEKWLSTINAWSGEIPSASNLPDIDLAVLMVDAYLDSGPSKSLAESFADYELTTLPLGDSDLAPAGSRVRIYGFGRSTWDETQLAMFTRGIVSKKIPREESQAPHFYETGAFEMIITDANMLSGHSGGMLLDSAGAVIGWCVESQMERVVGARGAGGAVPVAPAGVHNVRPIKLLRPALEAALASRPGASLEEKLHGADPLRAQSRLKTLTAF